jgi:hypothetical protein
MARWLAADCEPWTSGSIWASIMALYSDCLRNNLLTFRRDEKSPLSCRFPLVAKTSMRNRDINQCYVTYRLAPDMLCVVSRAGKTNDERSQLWLAGHEAWAEWFATWITAFIVARCSRAPPGSLPSQYSLVSTAVPLHYEPWNSHWTDSCPILLYVLFCILKFQMGTNKLIFDIHCPFFSTACATNVCNIHRIWIR